MESQTKALMTQALIQSGIVAALVLGSYAVAGCARKNTDPPGAQGSLSSEQVELLDRARRIAQGVEGVQGGEAAQGAETAVQNVTAKSIPNGQRLAALILKDEEMLGYRVNFEKKHNVICTRPAAGQMHWDCKSATECHFSLELTCVSNVETDRDNDEIRRIRIWGVGNATKMTYKLSTPTKTASESKTLRVKFED